MFSFGPLARNRKARLAFIIQLAWAAALPSLGYDSRFYAVEMHVRAERNPPALVFSWPQSENAREHVVRRKLPGESSWGPATVLPGSATGFTDRSVALGMAYEYEVQQETSAAAPEGGYIRAYSYALAGIDVTERFRRGRIILVVDSSIAGGITSELQTYRSDLLGAGWEVVQREVSRSASVTEAKNIIRAEYNAAPAQTRSVVLIGHVPVPYSGNIAPDMHASHRGAWPADVFYADMDGTWTDQSVSVRSVDYAENNNFPGDGKFDQSTLPSPAELEIGRIDFWQMPAFQNRSEVDLLRQYFRKNHQFRHRHHTVPRRGLVRDNFGDLDGDAPAVDAWRHYSAFFGPNSARETGPGEFFGVLQNEGHLWAYGCGGGANDKADGVGTTADFAANDPRAVFLILHGSYFGDWNYPDNFLRAAIATPSFTLASAWSGLPHWYFHHMALGETIGASTRASQNNFSMYRSHRNFSPAAVHVALMGDPTLEMFPVIPPANLSASAPGEVQLRWDASPDQNILGYHVFHSISQHGPYNRITAQPVNSTAFAHAAGPGMQYYMVRAVKLEETGSGTFRNLSQGIFASVSTTGGGISSPPVVTVTAVDSDAAEFRANAGSFKFVRDVVDGSALTVRFALGGAAQSGLDYIEVPGSVVIPAWSASAQVAIYPRSDNLNEGDENVVLQLENSGDYRIGQPGSASIVIRDLRVNQPPVLSEIGDQVLVPPAAFVEASFTISDSETPAELLTLRASSSNQALAPGSSLQLRGTGSNRTLRVTPASGIFGAATITVILSDGNLEASRTFELTVRPPIRPEIISIAPVSDGFVLRLKAAPGAVCQIDGSTNASNWAMIGQVTADPGGAGLFIDTRTTGAAIKLYRVVLK